MKSLWNEESRSELMTRIRGLSANRRGAWGRITWGRITCVQMVVHVTDAFALYTGELRVARKRTPLQYAPLKQAFVYVLPIPKNVPTAPELISRAPGAWHDEVARLERAVEGFCAQAARKDWPVHPIFGPPLGPRVGRAGVQAHGSSPSPFGV